MSFSPRHFWMVHVVTIVVCAFFAARAAGHLVAGLLAGEPLPPRTGERPAAAAAVLPMDGQPERATTAIVTRNIFCSTCEPAASSENPGSDQAGEANAAPVRTSLGYSLLATMVNEDDPTASVACIMDTSTNQSRVYSVGARLTDTVKIIEIGVRQVLLLNGGRQEFLSLGAEESYRPAPVAKFNRPEPEPHLEALADGMGQSAERKYWISRSVLDQMLTDPQRLFAGVRAVPRLLNGQPNGFAVYANVGSIPSLLGLFSGDVLQAVNGQPLTSPENALEVFRSLRGRSFNLLFMRKGVPLTHDYEVR